MSSFLYIVVYSTDDPNPVEECTLIDFTPFSDMAFKFSPVNN